MRSFKSKTGRLSGAAGFRLCDGCPDEFRGTGCVTKMEMGTSMRTVYLCQVCTELLIMDPEYVEILAQKLDREK